MKRLPRQPEHYLFEPFTWLFYCFFQPSRFKSEFEIKGLLNLKRIAPMFRLILPIFLISFTIIIIAHIIFLIYFPTFFSLSLSMGTVLSLAVGILGGLALGVGGNLTLGIIGSLTLEIVIGLTVGAVVGQMRAFVFAITAGLLFGLVEGSGLSLTVFAISGLTLGMVEGIPASIVGLVALSVAGGIVLTFARRTRKFAGIFVGGIVGFLVWFVGETITKGSTSGADSIINSTIFIISYMLGYYRIPLYPVSSLSSLKAYFDGNRHPSQVFTCLHRSSLYWDECILLPLPKLKDMLLLASGINFEQTLDLIALIIHERPQQALSARAASLEIVLRDLELHRSLYDIAQASQLLNRFLSPEADLIESKYILLLTCLNDASRDAISFFNLPSRQSRQEALRNMKTNLKKKHSRAMLRDTDFVKRLIKLANKWLTVCEAELAHLEQESAKSGSIHNPYIPGPVLKPGDALFVGRQDLAQQLEEALKKGIYRPTFFLFGERRMGKSSTLRHLPSLLGSHYIPVFYDLQAPGISASTVTLLSTMAQEIYEAVSSRGIKIKRHSYQQLKEASQENESAVYYKFDEWLKELEHTLEREDRTLLLTFDEFEQLEEGEQENELNLKLLLNWFRSIIQHRPRVALLFSGVHTIADMRLDWAGYFVNVQALKVSFLHPEDAYHLITQPVPGFSGEQIFGKDTAREILRVTGYHPFLIQALCSALIDHLNTNTRDHAESQDITLAIRRVLELWGSAYFQDLWNRTDDAQRLCLIALRGLCGGSLYQIEQQSGLTRGIAHKALVRLVNRDLVVLEQDKYRIAVPILAEWIESNKDREISS